MIDHYCSRFNEIKSKDFYYLFAVADPMPDAMDRAVSELQGSQYCLDDVRECGKACEVGVMFILI